MKWELPIPEIPWELDKVHSSSIFLTERASMRNIIRGEETEESVVEWWLEEDIDGCIVLKADSVKGGMGYFVLKIDRGKLVRHNSLGNTLGLKLDEERRIMLE